MSGAAPAASEESALHPTSLPGSSSAPPLRAARLLALALAAVPAAVALSYVFRIATDVPFYDEWRFIPFIEKWRAGQLGWTDLVSQHDGHRIITTRLLVLVSAWLTHWNVLFEVWGGFACLAATGLLLAWLHWRATRACGSASWTVASALALAGVVFSLRQWENLIAPWSFCIFSLGLLVLLTLLLVQRGRWIPAAVAATLASITFTNGFLVWPIAVIQHFIQEYRLAPSAFVAARRTAKASLAWLATGAAVLAAYFFRYDTGLAHAPAGAGVVGLRFLTALGNALSPDRGLLSGSAAISPATGLPLSIGLGVVVLAVLAITLWPRPRSELPEDYPLHVAMALFGLGSVSMLALGRSYLGVWQAVSSRYTSSVTFVLAAALLAGAHAGRAGRWANTARWSLVALALLANGIATRKELNYAHTRAAGLRSWAQRVRNYRTTTDEQFANPHYPPDQVRRWSEALERGGLSLFRGKSDRR